MLLLLLSYLCVHTVIIAFMSASCSASPLAAPEAPHNTTKHIIIVVVASSYILTVHRQREGK